MRTVSRTLQLAIAALVIVAGLGIASVRVLFPNADRYRDDLEIWLAEIAGRPVAIGSLEAEWRGLGPEFRITDLKLREPTQRGKDGGVNAHFESATVSVDVLASLLGGKLRPRHIQVGDVSLRVGPAASTAGPEFGAKQHGLAVLDWLLAQHRLELDATRVELADIRVADAPLTLTNVQLSVHNQGTSHALDVAIEIPGVHNGVLAAHARIIGDPASSEWSGDIGVAIAELDMTTLEAWLHPQTANDLAGRLRLNLDSRWYRGALVEAEGDASVRDMRFKSAGGTLGPLSGESLVEIARGGDGWRARLLPASGGLLRFRDPSPIATAHYTATESASAARITAAIRELDLAALAPLLPLALEAPDDLWRQLIAAQPSGRVRDFTLSVAGGADGVRDLAVAGTFHDAAIASAGGLPALFGSDGAFDHGPRGTRVEFTDGRIHASLPELFPEPLTGEGLHGELLLSGGGREWRLAFGDLGLVTPDVAARVNGELVWRDGAAMPFVDLTLGLRDGDLARFEYFVPTPLLGARTGRWLGRAFPRGHLTAATVELRGRPEKTLRPDSDFSFAVHADVRDASVHYLDGWPLAERVVGSLHIENRRIVGDVREAYIFGARTRPSHWVIDDILADNPTFEWQVRIDGTSKDAIRYLRESPLRKRFRSFVDNIDAGGSASLALDLSLPLGPGDPRVSGSLEITDNTLAVPSLGEGFTDIAGRIRFDQDGLAGEGLTSTYLGRTVSATIESIDGASGHTRARVSGTADAAYLARHLQNAGLLARADVDAMPILTRLEGETTWQATIDVLQRSGGDQVPVVLRVESALEGTTLNLPAPFTKRADAQLPVTVEARFADAAHRRMHVSLGALASGIFDLSANDGGYRLERGALHLGGGAATLPDESCVKLSGRMARADVGEWSAIVLKPRNGSGRDDALPTRVDLAIDRLTMLEAEFDGVRVTANGTSTGDWHASVSGRDLDGEVRIPADRSRHGIVADFERLAWTPVVADERKPPDPRNLPPLRFTCMRCVYGDLHFEDVELVTSKIRDGLRIDSLRLQNDGFEARADGAWTYDAARGQRTRLDVQLASEDLGKLLASLGHQGGATRGGVTEVSLAASWNGPPSDFDLENVDGVMRFRASEGTLTDVSRGTAGRLFGLLVVPDLPRRLKGDFSDLFDDGFAYKHIEGTFSIERGNAYTNDLTLDGSLARINIAGRTGLVDEDYDQLITVTPKLSESLPLVPIWLVEKAFKKEIFDKLFAYQYTITGSWDEPSVTRIVVEHDSPSDRS